MSQSGSAGSRHDWGTRLPRRPPLGEYAHATSAILGPSAGRDGLPAAPRGVVSGGGAHPRRHGARGQQPSVARPAGLPADPAAPPPHVVAHPSQARRSGPDLRGWQIRRVSELLRAQPGGRLRADPALSALRRRVRDRVVGLTLAGHAIANTRSEEHTSELQSQSNLVCRLLLEKKNTLRFHHYDGSELYFL